MTYRLEQTLINIILWLNPWLAQHALQSWHSCIRPVRSIRDRMCWKRGSGRTSRHALLTDASPGFVTPRGRWGHALTDAVPNGTISTRVRSSTLAIWSIRHPAMHAQSCRKVQHEIPMGWPSWISPKGRYSDRIVPCAASPLSTGFKPDDRCDRRRVTPFTPTDIGLRDELPSATPARFSSAVQSIRLSKRRQTAFALDPERQVQKCCRRQGAVPAR